MLTILICILFGILIYIISSNENDIVISFLNLSLVILISGGIFGVSIAGNIPTYGSYSEANTYSIIKFKTFYKTERYNNVFNILYRKNNNIVRKKIKQNIDNPEYVNIKYGKSKQLKIKQFQESDHIINQFSLVKERNKNKYIIIVPKQFANKHMQL